MRNRRTDRNNWRPKESLDRLAVIDFRCCPKEQAALIAKAPVGDSEAREQQLFAIELRTEAHHGVEQTTGKTVMAPKRSVKVDVPQTSRYASRPDITGAAAKQLLRDTGARKFPRRRFAFVRSESGSCVLKNRAADFQVRIERFARNEEPHDFARAFEDQVDAAIAQETLHRDRFFAAAGERLRGFVTAAAAHLHRVVGDLPGHFGRPHFAHGGFDPQIAGFPIDQRRGEERHRFHRERVPGHLRDLACDRVMLPDRDAPLDPFTGPFAADFEQTLAQTDARGRDGQATRCSKSSARLSIPGLPSRSCFRAARARP